MHQIILLLPVRGKSMQKNREVSGVNRAIFILSFQKLLCAILFQENYYYYYCYYYHNNMKSTKSFVVSSYSNENLVTTVSSNFKSFGHGKSQFQLTPARYGQGRQGGKIKLSNHHYKPRTW